MTEQKTEQRIINGRLYDIIKYEREIQSGETSIVKIPELNIDNLSNWFDINNYDLRHVKMEDVRGMLQQRRNVQYVLCNIEPFAGLDPKIFFINCVEWLGTHQGKNFGSSDKPFPPKDPIPAVTDFDLRRWLAIEIAAGGLEKFVDNVSDKLFMVDYSFSDELIIEDFKKCLAEKRKKHDAIGSRKGNPPLI